MSQLKDQEPSRTFEVQDFGTTSVKELFDQRVPQQAVEGKAIYERLAEQPLYLYKVELPDGSTEILVYGDQLDGERINGIAHYGAPSKTFAFDTDDILMDWRYLYSRPKLNAKRLKAHQDHIPNWRVFESERIAIYASIYGYKHKIPLHDKHTFVPVIAWKVLPDGTREWVIRKEQLASWDPVHSAHLAKKVSASENQYSVIIGSAFAAAYSPDVTKTWGDHLNYKLHAPSGQDNKQIMAATQDIPLVLGKANDLLGSDLALRIESRLGIARKLSEEQRQGGIGAMIATALLGMGASKADKPVVGQPFPFSKTPPFAAIEDKKPDLQKPSTYDIVMMASLFTMDAVGEKITATLKLPAVVSDYSAWISPALDKVSQLQKEGKISKNIYVAWAHAILNYFNPIDPL